MGKDVFGRLYKRSKMDRRSPKTDKQNQWIKNATRSVGDSAYKIVQEYFPAVTDTGVSMRDVRDDLRESLINTRRAGITKAGSLMSLGKEIWKNSLEDLKSGNFHNQERIDKNSNESLGMGDFDFDFPEDFDSGEGDFNVDVTSEDGLSSFQMNKQSGGNNEVTQINIDTNLGENSAIVRATENQTEISVQATQELARVSETNTKVMMTHLSKLVKNINGQLAAINDNVASVATVVSESLSAHVSVSAKYYEDSMELFRSIDTTIKEVRDLTKTTSSTDQVTKKPELYNSLDVINGGGGLDFAEYGKLIKKQFGSALEMTPLGFAMTSIKMAKQFGGVDEFKSSPLSSMLTSVMKGIIPGVVKSSMEAFGQQLSETLTTGLFKVNSLKRSTNPILQFIGNIFGISNKKYTANKKNYNKGAMAWNGIAHRTLVDVIPTYLRQIASALTGTEQKVFDYQEGKYRSLKDIQDEHDRNLKNRAMSPFQSIRSEFREFSRNFNLSTEQLEKYREGLDKYLTDIANSDGQMSFRNTDQLVTSVGDENIAKLIQRFMEYAPKDMVTAAYGRNALESVNSVNEYNRRMEMDPTKYNYQYIDNGLTSVSEENGNKPFGLKVDSYNHDSLYYLRKILQTINTSVPVRIIKGGKGFNKRILSEISAQSTSLSGPDNLDDKDSKSGDQSQTHPNLHSNRIDVDDLDNLSNEELKQKIAERDRFGGTPDKKKSKLLEKLKKMGVKEDSGVYRLASNITGAKNKAGDETASIFNKMTNTLFNFLFGEDKERGLRGVFNLVLTGVKKQMQRFGTFIDEKMLKPLNESLFGEEGLITKMKESETIEKLKTRIKDVKNKALGFIFGEKGEDGKRKGGLLGDTLNSLSEMGTSAKEFILHDEDGVVGSMKRMYNSVTTSVKNALGIDEDDNKEKVPLSQRIQGGASDFLTHIKQRGSEWVDLIFGGKETKSDKDKEKIIDNLGLFKSEMKGKGGKLGASATIGLIGSFFLPGGPIVGALLGLGTGIVSESTQLKQLLFGKLNEDGTRSDTGIISQQFQNFFKENKTGMAVGAFGGLMASFGLLPSLFIPGGPIGGAIIGGALSLAKKSGAFNELLYGEGGSEDNITGGITKFIKDHYKKDGNIKTTFMDAGMGAGVGLIGSFFLPGGPITGALLGAATNIIINTDKFKNLLFGEEVLDKEGNPTGKRKGGLLTKFTDYIGDKVLLPLSKAARVTQVKIMGFIEKHMVNPFKVAMKPFQIAGKNFVEGIKSTVEDIKQSFKNRVTKPIGDAVEEHILKPMRNAFTKIFSGLGKIIGSILSAPFKVFHGAGKSLNKTQVKKGQSDYDMDAELERLNMGTDAKTKRNLEKTRKENKKRKHFKSFFGGDVVPPKKTENSATEADAVQKDMKIAEPPSQPKSDVNEEETPTSIADVPTPYSKEEVGGIYEELNKQNESKTTVSFSGMGASAESSDIDTQPAQGSTTGTKMAMPLNLQYFAEKSGTKGSDSSEKTDGIIKILTNVETSLTSMSEKVTSILNILTNKESPSKTGVSSKNNPEDVPKRVSSIESNVKKIADSVDGQLNGVGYNVNKILRILLKKNGMSDSDVEGENNKKYSRFGKLKNLIMAPFNMLKGAVTGAVDAVKGVISGAIEGVTSIARGLLTLPKKMLEFGMTAVKGIGKTLLSIGKHVGSAITTGLNFVGNVLSSAADGFGRMIGEASEGFGQLIGGALGGIGNLLHGVGLIGKELAPVIGKAIGGIIKAPFKLAGMAGGFLSNLFGKNKKGNGKNGGVSHVIVDEYAGEDRVITALKAIEFAIIHGGPMDGEGPKFKGSTALPVNDPSTPEDESGKTKMSVPTNLQFFANSGKNGNGLPNTLKVESKEDEKLELATRVAEGSASEVNERFEEEDDKAEERSFRERLLGLFHTSNTEQKKQGINWSAIFSKKGLITGALIAAVPLLIKFLPKIWDIVKGIGTAIADIVKNFFKNLDGQGGLLGLLNGGIEMGRSVTDAVGLTDREEYAIGENGEILTDENGTAVKNTIENEGAVSRAVQYFTPTTTKIDHETGEAYQVQQYDAVTRGKIHYTRAKIGKGIKKVKKIKDRATRVADTVKNKAEKIAQSKTGQRVANSTAVKKVKDAASSAKSIASDKISKIIKFGKDAFDALIKKVTDFVKKYSKGGKLSKLLETIGKVFKHVFKPETIGKYMKKFTGILTKVTAAATTLATSELFWGVTGALEGATNAAYTFEVDDDAVDWKMRAIATLFRALLATSFGSWIDLADSIWYEISGTSLVNEVAVQLYYLISDDDDDEALRKAREDFNNSYDKYVEEEYAAYKKNQEENGQAAMSFEEFKASDIATSRQEYNSEQNKSFAKRAWDTVNGGWNKLKGGVKKIGTKIAESGIGGAVIGGAKKLGGAVVGGVKKAGGAIAGVAKKGVGLVKDAAVGVGSTVVGGAKKIGGALVGGAKKLGGAVVGGVKKAGGAIAGGLSKVKDTAVNIGSSIKEKWDNSKLKEIVGGITNFGATLSSGLAGILKNAWTGDKEDLITFPADDDSIGTAMTKFALIGGKVILTPVTAVIKLVRFLKDKIGGFIGGVADIGSTIGQGISGIIQTAWTGDDSNLVTFSADDKSIGTAISKFVLIGADALLTPVKGVIKLVRILKDKFGEIKTAVGTVGKQIFNSTTGRMAAAWNGEDYTPGGFEGAGPLTHVCSVIDTVAGVIMTPVTGVIKIGKFLFDKFQQLKNAIGVVGSQIGSSVGGRISAAWNGEDYTPGGFEGAGPLANICSVIDTTAGIVTTPVVGVIKVGRFLYDKFQELRSAMLVVNNQIGESVGGRVVAAWNGEEYEAKAAEGAGPLTTICNVVDTAAGVIMTPVVGVIKVGRFLYDKFQELRHAMGVVGGQISESVGGRIAAAWKGEEYEAKEPEEAGPLANVCSVIDTVAGFITTPITLGIKAFNFIGDKVSEIWSGMKKFGANIASYWDVFGSKTTVDNYWTRPKDKDESGFLGGISSIFFYLIRGLLAIPFYLTTAVKNIGKFIYNKLGDFANGVADFFGAGSAFNVEDEDGGSGGKGGSSSGTTVHNPASKLNGFTYYSQNDDKLKNQSYDQSDGTPGTMGERGCGPTALSMVASELTGQDYDPTTMARMAENTGYSTEVGTTTGYFGNVGSTLGMGVAEGQANPDAIRTSLQNGNPIILQGTGNGNSPYTSNGHYVVGVGMKGDNVLVNDPRGPQYSGLYPMESVMKGASGMWSFSGGMGPSGTANLKNYNPYMDKYSNTNVSTAQVSGTANLQNYNPYMGTTISTSDKDGNEEAEQALVNAMYSVKDKLKYDMEGPRDPDQGSADCSSTVRWAYQKTIGVDPGGYTGAQVSSPAGFTVDSYSGGAPDESKLRPGDLLFYGKNGVHDPSGVSHVEMYVGDNKLMGHGGGKDGSLPGPTEKDMSSYRTNGYINARRYIGEGTDVVNNFSGASSSGSSTGVSSSSTSTGESSGSDGFSLSNLFSGAINAIQTGISNFFGMSSSGSDSSGSSSSSSGTSSVDGSNSSIVAANINPGDEQKSIWQYWIQQGLTKEGTAGLMGNLEQESGNHAVRLQGDLTPPYQKSQEYTKNVDSGSYSDSNFVNDKKGYGLAQWTWHTRKQGLLDAARANNTSVGDLGTQLAYLNHELNTKYPSVLNTLKTATDIKTASNAVLHDFEAPKDQGPTVENQRASMGQGYYDKFSSLAASDGSAYIGSAVSDTASIRTKSPYINGGNGPGPKSKSTIANYKRAKNIKSTLGGNGPGPSISPSQSQQMPTPNYNTVQSKPSSSPMENMSKLFDYLGKIVGYLESTSSGISQLNQKDFGGSANYVNSPTYTSVNGEKQSPPPDTSNYEFGRIVAQGQLV